MTRYFAGEATVEQIQRIVDIDVGPGDVHNSPVMLLSDRHTKSDALIVPSIGHQCIAFRIDLAGQPLNIIDVPPDLQTLREHPIFYGNPILFPFPGRIRHGKFRFEGQEYVLPINDPVRGHAIHGFVYDRPWTMTSMRMDDVSASVTATFVSTNFPEVDRVFPFPFRLDYTYRLKDGALHHEFTAVNLGEGPMPMGFGLHPWFPAPLSNKGARARCHISAPVDHMWEIDDSPTGRIIPTPPTHHLANGIQLGTTHYDDVYAGLAHGGRGSVSTYTDACTGVQIEVVADKSFRELVIYASIERNTVCIEPLTCTVDAFNLDDNGIESGMIRLNPGESWSGRVAYRATVLSSQTPSGMRSYPS